MESGAIFCSMYEHNLLYINLSCSFFLHCHSQHAKTPIIERHRASLPLSERVLGWLMPKRPVGTLSLRILSGKQVVFNPAYLGNFIPY